MEHLLVRHRKEQKDLQGRVTQKKKNATKKTRKGVNDECERLERELKEHQQAEIDALNGTSIEQNLDELHIDDPTAAMNDDLSDEPQKVNLLAAPKVAQNDEPEESERSRKPNRQKARLARRAAEQEAQVVAATEEAANQPDLREQEMKAMEVHKKKLGLIETFIRPDGHCLFSACARGLPAGPVKDSGPFTEGYQNIRYGTANYMMRHRNDFEAFIEEPFDSYIKKIRDTAEWGGQLELQAIARSYDVTINVLQADGHLEKFQPNGNNKAHEDVWLAYYRHSFGLGEHYNALSKK